MDDKHAGAGTPGDRRDNRSAGSSRSTNEVSNGSEEERPAFLARVCAGDDALRREVEKLLSFDEKAGVSWNLQHWMCSAGAGQEGRPGKRIDFVGQTIFITEAGRRSAKAGWALFTGRSTRTCNVRWPSKVLPPEIVGRRQTQAPLCPGSQGSLGTEPPNIITIHDIGPSRRHGLHRHGVRVRQDTRRADSA